MDQARVAVRPRLRDAHGVLDPRVASHRSGRPEPLAVVRPAVEHDRTSLARVPIGRRLLVRLRAAGWRIEFRVAMDASVLVEREYREVLRDAEADRVEADYVPRDLLSDFRCDPTRDELVDRVPVLDEHLRVDEPREVSLHADT